MAHAQLPLPDPKIPHGPYRPFACDPGWSEAWWWLGIPLFVAVFMVGSYLARPPMVSTAVVLPEGYGAAGVLALSWRSSALFIAARLLFRPFVRARPLVFAVAMIGALSCLYIAGEEMSWGQHFFHWNTPEYWAMVNRQEETNLHNTYYIFEKLPRCILEIGIAGRRPRSCRSPPSSIPGCGPAGPRCSCRPRRSCRGDDRDAVQGPRSAAASSTSSPRWSPAKRERSRPISMSSSSLYFIVYRAAHRELEAAERASAPN